MPLDLTTSAASGTRNGGSIRSVTNETMAYIPGSSTPLGLSTSTSVSSVLDCASRELDVRVTLPLKLRLGICCTVTVAVWPTRTPGAFVCGTAIKIRSLPISARRKISPPLGTSDGPAALDRAGPRLEPVAEMSAPTSTFRAVMMPSNGAVICS